MRLECGIDEAGRGPLAGPVVAAAVILDPSMPIIGLGDSKQIAEKRRQRIAEEIKARSLAWSVGFATVEEIDRLNILQATFLAMVRAVAGLKVRPSHALIDGNRCPALECTAEAVVGGDATIPCISAASILAKVTRDEEMLKLHDLYPEFGLDRHKGYPTEEHRRAIAVHGIREIHRRSFGPVREILLRGKGLPDAD